MLDIVKQMSHHCITSEELESVRHSISHEGDNHETILGVSDKVDVLATHEIVVKPWRVLI